MATPLHVAVTVEQSWQRVPGGTAASTNALLDRMRHHPDLRLVGIAARHRRPAPPPWQPPVVVHHLPLPRAALYRGWHGLRWPPVNLGLGPHAAPDVIHATSPAVPPATAPLVATVHDLAFLDEPGWYSPRGVAFLRRGTELARRHAVRVVVPSATTRDECVLAGFEPDLLRVIPHGVQVPQVLEADVRGWRERSGLTRPYVLWCGTHEPRKNLPALLTAYTALVSGADDPGVDLVLVGPPGWGRAAAPPAEVADRIRATGFLPTADLHAAYAGAAAFCYPSLREGFGMPVLEAMAHGIPVVTSAASPMAQLAADSAVLVDPHDPASITEGLREALRRPERYGPAGQRRAGDFTWDAAATTLAAVYAEAAGTGRRNAST